MPASRPCARYLLHPPHKLFFWNLARGGSIAGVDLRNQIARLVIDKANVCQYTVHRGKRLPTIITIIIGTKGFQVCAH
jgi:hypothetical protein